MNAHTNQSSPTTTTQTPFWNNITMEDSMEINFHLDTDGRTIDTRNSNSEKSAEANNNDAQKNIDYTPRTCHTIFPLEKLDDLLLDCEIADSGLMPRTFWVPIKDDFSPRFSLEQWALDIFRQHTKGVEYDPDTSGAEWWVQLRPSPETGRYSMHSKADDNMTAQGISFHWDKDEELRIICGGSTFVHPHLSSVTYLTSIGAPTLTTNCRVQPLTGAWLIPDEHEAFLSWPQQGKQLIFDGRFLHAAPPDLMKDGEFQKQIAFQASPDDDATKIKQLLRSHRRVTFLVNIWLNYRPLDVQPFPEMMLDKMSGGKDPIHLKFAINEKSSYHEEVVCNDDSSVRTFEWPMGDCGSQERIVMDLSQQVLLHRDSVRLSWKSREGVQLLQGKGNKRQKVSTTETD